MQWCSGRNPFECSISSKGDFDEDTVELANTVEQGWRELIRSLVYENSEVEALYVAKSEEGLIDYWIVIPERNLNLVREIVAKQQGTVLTLFAESNAPFNLDFHIVYRNGRDVRELVPSGADFIPPPTDRIPTLRT